MSFVEFLWKNWLLANRYKIGGARQSENEKKRVYGKSKSKSRKIQVSNFEYEKVLKSFDYFIVYAYYTIYINGVLNKFDYFCNTLGVN